MTGIKATGGTSDVETFLIRLSASEQLDVAIALVGLKGIWDVESSPWPDMAISTDKSGVEKNISAMKKAVKDSEVIDKDSVKGAPKLLAVKSETSLKGVSNNGTEEKGLLGSAADKASSWFGGSKESKPTTFTMSKPDLTSTPSNLPLKPEEEKPVSTGSGGGSFLLPAQGRISSQFGMRTHPKYGTKKPHNGIDIAAPLGTPVYAAYGGFVKVAQQLRGYGNTIYLHHDNGYETRYAHLDRFADGIRCVS